MNICITELLCCTPGTSNIVSQLYSNKIKLKKIFLIQNFCAKDTLKVKSQFMAWEKILENYLSDKGLISRIYEGLLHLNNNKRNNLKNGEGHRHFLKEMNGQ